jgi:hypothetical protein
MSKELRISFADPCDRWLDVTIECSSVAVTFSTSSTPRDSVTELAAALLQITRARGEVSVVWNQEPDEIETLFRREGSTAELRVVVVDRSKRARANGSLSRRTLATYSAPAGQIVAVFAQALDRLRDATTDGQYEKAWGHGFPHEAVDALMAAKARQLVLLVRGTRESARCPAPASAIARRDGGGPRSTTAGRRPTQERRSLQPTRSLARERGALCRVPVGARRIRAVIATATL